MVRNYVLAAAVAAGGLAVVASAPASAAEAPAGASIKLNAAKAEIMNVGWRGRGGWRRGGYYRGRGWGYRRGPAFGIYVAPRRAYYRRCWINRWGYRVCG